MTKGEIKGQAYLKISGGHPNADVSVYDTDLDTYLCASLNYLMHKQYFMDKQDEFGDKVIQRLFLQKYVVPVEKNDRVYVGTLPKKPLSLPRQRAVSYVGTDSKQFMPIEDSGESMQCYYQKFKKNQSSFAIEGREINIHHAPLNLKHIVVKMMVDVSQLSDDDEIIIPSGSESELVNMLVEFFLGQRQIPKDIINSGKDVLGSNTGGR